MDLGLMGANPVYARYVTAPYLSFPHDRVTLDGMGVADSIDNIITVTTEQLARSNHASYVIRPMEEERGKLWRSLGVKEAHNRKLKAQVVTPPNFGLFRIHRTMWKSGLLIWNNPDCIQNIVLQLHNMKYINGYTKRCTGRSPEYVQIITSKRK